PLEIQRDPDPIGRAAAEIAVQLHVPNLPLFLSLALLTLAILSVYCQSNWRMIRKSGHRFSEGDHAQTKRSGGQPWKPCKRLRSARRSTKRSKARASPRCGT